MGRVSRQAPTRLAEKIKIIRESLGLSQGGMLKHLGLSEKDGLFRSSISGYELGTRLPPYIVLLAYARSVNIYVEVLIDDELDLPSNLPPSVKSEGVKVK
jgi:transcriptional regulator with XRE-family HTH domain